MAVAVNALKGSSEPAEIVRPPLLSSIKLLRAAFKPILEACLIRTTGSGETSAGAAAKRIKTLRACSGPSAAGLLWFIVVLITLSPIGVNIDPILAGAGRSASPSASAPSIWCAILVSDSFLLLENRIRVGDMAIVNGTGGVVESVTFRTVALRDQAGRRPRLANGWITTLANAAHRLSSYASTSPSPATKTPTEDRRSCGGSPTTSTKNPNFGPAMIFKPSKFTASTNSHQDRSSNNQGEIQNPTRASKYPIGREYPPPSEESLRQRRRANGQRAAPRRHPRPRYDRRGVTTSTTSTQGHSAAEQQPKIRKGAGPTKATKPTEDTSRIRSNSEPSCPFRASSKITCEGMICTTKSLRGSVILQSRYAG